MKTKEELELIFELKTHIESRAFQELVMKPLFKELEEIKGMFEQLMGEVDTIHKSLKSCQSRCHVDNPPTRWKGFLRAFTTLFKIG